MSSQEVSTTSSNITGSKRDNNNIENRLFFVQNSVAELSVNQTREFMETIRNNTKT